MQRRHLMQLGAAALAAPALTARAQSFPARPMTRPTEVMAPIRPPLLDTGSEPPSAAVASAAEENVRGAAAGCPIPAGEAAPWPLAAPPLGAAEPSAGAMSSVVTPDT